MRTSTNLPRWLAVLAFAACVAACSQGSRTADTAEIPTGDGLPTSDASNSTDSTDPETAFIDSTLSDNLGNSAAGEIAANIPPNPPWLFIAGGPVALGCAPGDSSCGPDEPPAHLAELAPFEVLEHEVSVAEYSDCTATGVCDTPDLTGEECEPDSLAPNSPATCLNWLMAKQYCRALGHGSDLPTQDQWERLARSGCVGSPSTACMHVYVWGDQWPPPPGSVNLHDDSNGAKSNTPGYNDGYQSLAPVKAFPPTTEGVFGLGGNVFEYVLDGDGLCGPPDVGRGCNIRDASYAQGNNELDSRVSARGRVDCCKKWKNVGIRCARPVVGP